MQVSRKCFEVIADFLFGEEEFFFDDFFDKGVDEGLQKEGIFQGRQITGRFLIQTPHSV